VGRVTTDDVAPSIPLASYREDFSRFMLSYKFAVSEVMTKITILREEYQHIHRYNPIEHLNSRIKTPQSIIGKARRKGVEMSLDALRDNLRDIAGIRVICSFLPDVYTVRDALCGQDDLTVLSERDYVAQPKANGYRSLHLIIEVPVFLSDRTERVPVEVQIRTIAMDFWASLEHKIYYKYDGAVPGSLLTELTAAAGTAASLDTQMNGLHQQIRALAGEEPSTVSDLDLLQDLPVPPEIVAALLKLAPPRSDPPAAPTA